MPNQRVEGLTGLAPDLSFAFVRKWGSSPAPKFRSGLFNQHIKHFPPTLCTFLIKMASYDVWHIRCVPPLTLNAYLDHNDMLHNNTVFVIF